MPGATDWGDCGIFAAGKQHDGTTPAGEDVAGGASQEANPSGNGQIADHHGEGFAAAALAFPQSRDGLFVRGIAGKVETAEALDGNHGAATEQFTGAPRMRRCRARRRQARCRLRGRRRTRGPARAARGTGVGLRRGSGGQRGLRIPRGRRRTWEARHGGVGTVVGDIANDGVARAAVGAVGEGVTEAAVGGRCEVGDAVWTNRDIGRDQSEAVVFGNTVADDEFGIAARGHVGEGEVVDAGERGQFRAERMQEAFDIRSRAFHFDSDTFGGIENETAQATFTRQPVNKGAKTDALDDALNFNSFANDGGCHGADQAASCAITRSVSGPRVSRTAGVSSSDHSVEPG